MKEQERGYSSCIHLPFGYLRKASGRPSNRRVVEIIEQIVRKNVELKELEPTALRVDCRAHRQHKPHAQVYELVCDS